VERGIAPENLVVTDNNSGRTRPLCEWPAWPRYDGSGDVKSASSFTCVQPAQVGTMLQASTQ
jgi:feruloyl esterase